MGHFTTAKNVKKIQVLCFQCFRKLSNFAYLRPQDFNFRIIDSQSTFFDFLSKEFRTVSEPALSIDRPCLPRCNGILFLVPLTVLRPHEDKPFSIISTFFSLLSFVKFTLLIYMYGDMRRRALANKQQAESALLQIPPVVSDYLSRV